MAVEKGQTGKSRQRTDVLGRETKDPDFAESKLNHQGQHENAKAVDEHVDGTPQNVAGADDQDHDRDQEEKCARRLRRQWTADGNLRMQRSESGLDAEIGFEEFNRGNQACKDRRNPAQARKRSLRSGLRQNKAEDGKEGCQRHRDIDQAQGYRQMVGNRGKEPGREFSESNERHQAEAHVLDEDALDDKRRVRLPRQRNGRALHLDSCD